MSELPEIVKIKKIVRENPYMKTFIFDKNTEARPGQFVMVWIPRLDEKPFSLSYIGNETGITAEKKGKFTERLFSMKEGDKIGIRGPYGRGFVPKANACVVAGGCGIAPLSPLIEKLENPVVILGARSKDRLLFLKRFPNAKITTDDGSFGEKGFTTDVLEKVLENKKFGTVYTCGPEIMMKKVFEICESKGIECQASLERFMKCGLGVCGQCEVNGFRVCKDGPVFFSEQIREMKGFGKEARLKSGEKVTVNEFIQWRSK